MIKVPVWSWETGVKTQIEVEVPVLDVHELLWYLHTRLGIRTPPEKVVEYWEHQKKHGNPHAVAFPGTEHVPFSLYGDEVSVGAFGDPADKITGVFVSLTLFKPRVIKYGHHLVFGMKDCEMIHESLATMIPILRHLTWSCNVAYSGRFPSCSADGSPLPGTKAQRAGQPLAAGVVGFAITELKGDWLYHQRVLRLRDIPVARKVCFLCSACRDDASNLKYYDLCENAPWRSTLVDVSQFINHKVRDGALSYLAI